VTAAAVPANTNSTRSAHFRELLGGSWAIVGGAILAATVFTIGAANHWAGVMILGPVAGALVIVIWCWVVADRRAEDEFFKRYAAAHALNHHKRYSLDAFTPLLGGGDRRHCEHWMESKGRALGWYTFECREDNGDKPDTWEPHHFTLATVDVGELGMGRFQGVYLRRRRGILDRLDTDANWLRGHRLKKVELESTAFHERFELRAGELVVFIPDRCGEAGKLDFLMMAAAEISKRIETELSDAAQAGRI
jgi:hypothetical protein